MSEAELHVRLPPGTWMHDVSTTYADATFQVLSVSTGGAAGYALLEVTGQEIVDVLTAVEAREDVDELDVLSMEQDSLLVSVKSCETALFDPILDAGVALQTPFRIRRGEAEWTITASRSRLSDLATQLDATGVSFEVQYVNDDVSNGSAVLTDRQREVLAGAVEMGYFEIPREAGLDEVAAAFDISKSTCSDILRRGQANVTKWYLDALADDEASQARNGQERMMQASGTEW